MAANIIGIILAGGRSARMSGHDKSFIALGDKPLIEHVIDRARPQVAELFINTNSKDPRYGAYNLPLLSDTLPNHAGPLAGLLTGMELVTKSRPNCSLLASFAVDCPFYPLDLVTRLTQALQFNQAQIAIPRYRGQEHWVLGVWSTRLRDDLRNFLVARRRRKMQEWVKQHAPCFVDFDDCEFDPFCNINTPRDLHDAIQHLDYER